MGAAAAASQSRSEAEVLEDMLDVLRSAASVRSADRALAVRYTETRAALLAGRLGSFAPQYLTQCVSVFKFQEFINLYAHAAALRVQFIDDTFGPCRTALGFTRRFDVFGEDAG